MAAPPESRIPGPGGGGGKEKRRSFLPAPKRSSAIADPTASLTTSLTAEVPELGVKPLKASKQELLNEDPLKAPTFAKKQVDEEPAPPREIVPGSGKLAVGKRVLISGVKPGILRYVGKTHIAPGFWCGVELFDASGLHDGEVDGKRYFSCKSFRGIFAPLDKVVFDESAEETASYEEPRSQKSKIVDRTQAATCEEKRGTRLETDRTDSGKRSPDDESSASKLPAPGRSQIARLSGIPRVGGGGGVVKSTSADTLSRAEKGAPEQKKQVTSTSDTNLNSTFTIDEQELGQGRVRTISESSEGEGNLNQTYSCTVEKQLQSDSRRYFNITFNRDTPPPGNSSTTTSNLPDVVSSASPSPSPPSREGQGRIVLNQTQSAQDIAVALATDLSLGLMDPDILADETNLLEGLPAHHVTASTSESDISQSNSSTLDEGSVATVAEVAIPGLTSTPLQGEGLRKFLEEEGVSRSLCEDDVGKTSEEVCTSDVKRNLGQTFAASAAQESAQRKDSSGSSNSNNSAITDASFPQKQELLQEEGSNGISPEVSQVLEWDYDHDAFDGTPGTEAKDGGPQTNARGQAGATVHDAEPPSDGEEPEYTATGLESEESECDDEEEGEITDSEDGDEVDDLPEDERIEADRPAPRAGAAAAAAAAAAPRGTTPAGGAGVVPPPSAALAVPAGDEMTESANREGSDMTESAGPGVDGADQAARGADDSERSAADPRARETTTQGKGDNTCEGEAEAEPSTAGGGGQDASAIGAAVSGAAGSGPDSSPKQTRGRRGSGKNIVVEHKKVNVKAASSRLADYIKAPLPTKPRDEKKAEAKTKTKNAGKTAKGPAGKAADNGSCSAPSDKAKGEGGGKTGEQERDRRQTPVKEEKPKVKRVAPKSKWGNIMSQIEASKDTVKVKPKSEIKSSLAVYLSTPATPNTSANNNSNNNSPNPGTNSPTVKKEKESSKPRSKLVNHPKPDFSNIKSKLNFSSPPSKPAAPTDANAGPGSAAATPNTKTAAGKKGIASKTKQGRMQVDHLGRLETPDTWSVQSQAASSTTDLSQADVTDTASPSLALADAEQRRNSASRVAPRLKTERARASSVASSRSDHSTPRSVKTMNLRNAQKSDSQQNSSSSASQGRRSNVKSSIPPPNQSRSRPKGGGGGGGQLKSGHPPDVVSTSARGTRAQEVARLESLCETRTKELNYTKMQLKAGLQAFDAMACLLNYCTDHLDAFNCPQVTARLKVAQGKISEQQEQIGSLEQQKADVERQLAEVTQAREAALADVGRLQREMAEAEEAHVTAVGQLQDAHAAALAAQQQQLQAQHQDTTQQLQKYHEKQLEYTQQSQTRQISEMVSEHQMATNQLRVAHLEEIQELRNKHDKQMEELHAQHRNKLEDITRRFESIKQSLSEKVESLCVECDDLRVRAKTSEEALQRDADVKVQLALTPYLHLPKEIESLKTVIDMRTEEIQKLRRQNMDLVKQLEELPIAQEKVASLQQKVENLQAIINIKTDHEKQMHEKCQVLMRKYDRESRANKRLSMDYEQVVWRMSQSADFTGSPDLSHPLSHSPTRSGAGDHASNNHNHTSPSPVHRSLSNNAHGDGMGTGVTRRQRKTSGGEEEFDRKIRCRSATFTMDKAKAAAAKNSGAESAGLNGSAPVSASGSPSKQQQQLSRSADYAEEIAAALSGEHDESWSSGHFSTDPSDPPSLEASLVLDTSKDFFQTPQGVSYSVVVATNGHDSLQDKTGDHQDEVFEEDAEVNKTTLADDTSSSVADTTCQANVTVVVESPVSE